MLRQDAVQQPGAVVEGEADPIGQPLGLHFLQKAEAVVALADTVDLLVEPVEEVDVKFLHTAALLLLAKPQPTLLPGGYLPRRQLVGQNVGVSGMALHQRLAQTDLTGAAQIGVGRVEIPPAPLQEAIHHPADQLHIEARLILRHQPGQTQKTKSGLVHPSHPPFPCIR